MKLSEAIRMNGMMKPQGFGSESARDTDAPCAIGGALQSIGRQTPARFEASAFGGITTEWPFVREVSSCPACFGDVCSGRISSVVGIIWRLNDVHRWTRSQIADWVATVEPQETEIRPTPSELATEKCFVE